MKKPTGWKNESRRHSLARKGIKTNIDDSKRLAVNNYVARGKDVIDDDVIKAVLEEITSEWDDYSWDGKELKVYNNGKLVTTITRMDIIYHYDLDNIKSNGCFKSSGKKQVQEIEYLDWESEYDASIKAEELMDEGYNIAIQHGLGEGNIPQARILILGRRTD